MGFAHLSGYGEFDDRTQHVRVGRTLEYYVDDVKAIFRVAVQKNGRIVAWRERVFTQLYQRQAIRIQISMLLMSDDVEDLGSERIRDEGREMCTHCDGYGTIADMDGDNVMCTWCDGVGWI